MTAVLRMMSCRLRPYLLAAHGLFAGSCFGQEGLGNDGWPAALTAGLKALNDARSEAVQDSLSDRVKAVLRPVLEADDAMDRTFGGIPLTVVDAPDGRFRLFTWNLARPDGTHRYEAMLLVNDGRRRVLFELRDMTDRIPAPEAAELGPENWYGALYYDVVPVKQGGRTWYTLLGWKGQSRVETRKVIEVLSFRGGKPRFGAPLFEMPAGSGDRRIRPQRRVFAYAAQAAMSLRKDPAAPRIVFDHLAPTRPDLANDPAFRGPDLSYDAYEWDKGVWRFHRDVDARDLDMNRPWNAPPKEGRSKF
ncbi:MAG: hypothetical protein IT228_14785 [Flavobacteriales bacterium]|nr:hypothetical protein [Flavobacteriales bacterium]MCC6578605.1 hypothetical protein [Flavobacteriales bacterium]NUQ15966.1 hypothetical protein [Flavobacteriales bacterium]